jgi:hypothetical protein
MSELLKANLHDCLRELECLREMIAALATDQRIGRLAKAIEQTAQRPDLGSLESEQAIETITSALRRLIIVRAHEHSDPHFRSPPYDAEKLLPQGKTLTYSYERSLEPAPLEEKITRSAPEPPGGWSAQHVAFGSGMAAIAATLQAWQRSLRPFDNGVRLGVWGGYYETRSLLNVMRSRSFEWEDIERIDHAVARGGFDAFFVEPVRYDWDLTPFDLTALARGWRARSGGHPVFIFDTTLSSFTFPLRRVLQDFGDDPPPLVIDLRSGLKLDQQGLELANLGAVSVYCPGGDPRPAEEFAHYLEITRAVTGAAPSLDAIAALDVPFVLEPVLTRIQAGQVFQRNREAAAALAATRGLFDKVRHPSLHPGADAVPDDAPFIVCHLPESENTLANHGLLLAVLRTESRRQGLCTAWGASFGFRSHRFETIFPDLQAGKGIFKVAMGSRGGPSARGTVQLLERVAAFPDFGALGDAYPEQAALAKQQAAAWESAIRDTYTDFPPRRPSSIGLDYLHG